MDSISSVESIDLKRLNRKVRIKNIMIAFLAAMLILTFFSNTIMNYCLPEVSVCKLASGVVSRKVDASTIIESNQDYVVFADDRIEIKRVAAKKGQIIKEGQILFYLNPTEESSEVKELRDMIDEAKLQYEKNLLELGNDYFTENQQIQMARDELNAAIAARDNAEQNTVAESGYNSNKLTELSKRLNLLNRDMDALNSANYDGLSSESKLKIQNKLNAYNSANRQYIQLSESLAQSEKSYSGDDSLTEYERNLAELKLKLERLKEDNANKRDIEDAQMVYDYALSDFEKLNELKKSIENQKVQLALAENNKNSAWAALEPEINELSDNIGCEISELEREKLLFESENDIKYDYVYDDKNDYDSAVNNARYSLDSAIHALESKIKSDNLENKSKNLDLEAAKKKIEEQEKKLAELLEKKSAAEIVSPVDGIVQEIYGVTGGCIEADEQLIKINILNEGFKAVVTLNKDAAETIYKGQEAKVCEHPDVKAIVKNIEKSKNNSNSFDVTLEVTGDIEAGQQLKVQFSESSDQASNVIPKKAVKEDSSGKFVYGVISINTPIGNRYIAKKIPVSVLSEDDTQCSISGEFGDSADYIIIASSKPFSSGDKVRLAGE